MEAYSDNSLTRKKVDLNAPAMTIISFVQPRILAKFFNNVDLVEVGLAPRFLPCFHYLAQRSGAVDNTLLKMAKEKYQKHVYNMLVRNYTQNPAREIFTINYCPESMETIRQYELGNAALIEQGHYAHMVPFMSKLHGHVARVAGSIHAAVHERPELHPVEHNTVQAAVEIVNALVRHADFAYSPSGLGAYRTAVKILEWVVRHERNEFNSSQAIQGIKGAKKDDVLPALDLLESCNFLVQHIVPGRARICLLHPAFLYRVKNGEKLF